MLKGETRDPSIIALRHTTQSLAVQKMCWATSVCGRHSGNYQNTHVYELAAGLENIALDTERASIVHDILLRILPYFNAR
jgi:hypothetical protein